MADGGEGGQLIQFPVRPSPEGPVSLPFEEWREMEVADCISQMQTHLMECNERDFDAFIEVFIERIRRWRSA